ncbi:hypothetical protein BDY19DRAFT_976609 [Irpex rosettiformis]|uniref:Uncharacterized protein n=1 Tax=Irpex rosettiformis TaxID=378272 RepID=A0ACB8TNQ5_9APHY|nr:hypothetical protein BDY19DRAFT_976609 [Irpex rosettiformis]
MVELVSWIHTDVRIADKRCSVILKVENACSILVYIVLALFAAIRTYALWNKNLRVFSCVLGTGLIYPVVYTYYYTRLARRAFQPPITGCVYYYSTLPTHLAFRGIGTGSILHIIGVTGSMVFECITVVLTWMKTVPIMRELWPNRESTARSLCHVIFHDGTLQFIALVLMNVVGMLGFLRESISFVFTGLTQMCAFVPLLIAVDELVLGYSLTPILVSRAILDLRRDFTTSNGIGTSMFHISDMSNIRFDLRESSIMDHNGTNVVPQI